MQRHTQNWHDIDWKRCHEKVKYLQYQIVVAHRSEGKEKQAQHNLVKSFAARALAVRTVTSNAGKKTPGVDGVLWETPTAKWNAVVQLAYLESYRAQPVKRVWISKDGGPVLPGRSNGRPLGIPTLFDRAVQSLWNLVLSPIAEITGDRHSFGFRPYRSTKDAAEMLFIRLGTRHRPTWILEADIEGFFNKISHDWMLSNIPVSRPVLQQWLKAGHIEYQSVESADSGVPQGGCISPTISNMVLDGLSECIKEAIAPHTSKTRVTSTRSNTKVTMIRYADDFVVTCTKREMLEEILKPAIEGFLRARGLRLSPNKTVITSLDKGFDFVGYNIRLYHDRKKLPDQKVLLIKPSVRSITRIKNKILLCFDRHKKSSAYTLIHELNPILRGWANYHRTVVSKKVFNRIGYLLWNKTWEWARAKHPHSSRRETVRLYYERVGRRHWVFTGSLGESRLLLYDIANVPIGRHTLCQDLNPYLPENYEYFQRRRQKGTVSDGLWDKRSKQLLKRERFLCPVCEMPIVFGEDVETHHKLAKRLGGSDANKNLVILHRDCHKQVTYSLSETLRARFVERGIVKERWEPFSQDCSSLLETMPAFKEE